MSVALLFAGVAACGMAVQRSTGIGFALVAVPMFSLVLGPIDGVLLANALSMAVSILILFATWRDVSPRMLLVLGPAGVVGAAAGSMMVRALPEYLLYIVAGSFISVGVALVYFNPERLPFLRRGAAAGTAVVSGLLNATASAGGSIMAIYAAGTRWPLRSFVPNVQVLAIVMNIVSLSIKGLPSVSPVGFSIAIGGLFVGMIVSSTLLRKLSEHALTRFALAVALTGGLAAVAKGVAVA